MFSSDEKESYKANEDYEWNFQCDDIVLEGVKKKYLLNTGLLTLEGAENGDFDNGVIIKINMMVNVKEDKESDSLTKHIIYEH